VKLEDEDGIDGPFNRAMARAMEDDKHRKSTSNPDWPYERYCVECGGEWSCKVAEWWLIGR